LVCHENYSQGTRKGETIVEVNWRGSSNDKREGEKVRAWEK